MDPRRRDGLLALATCTLLAAISIRTGRAAPLLDPLLALVGTVGSLTLELLLLRHPERTRAVWERPVSRAVAVVVTVAAGVVAVLTAPWLVGVLVWGLLAYLALLVVVVVSGENPLARLVRQS